VKQGEAIGIIGRNGAGKSTLLKILSRITEPTTGRVAIKGRVASLLEVGTGFHPELTGRENIYLNGAILGMSKVEIKRKFDEIVAFAEVEKFLDTPVKRYSSGMYVRLAFAVAAHLEPEILVVDEVLAVGDAQFQKKCLGKMGDVATKEGRTVLFVSHNMGTVQRLCKRAIVLNKGLVLQEGEANVCVKAYLESYINKASKGLVDISSEKINRLGSGKAQFLQVELFKQNGTHSDEFFFGQPFSIRLTIQSHLELLDVTFGFSFVTADGTEIQGTSAHDGGINCNLYPGIQVVECRIDPMVLTPGRYYLRGAIFRLGELFDRIDEITSFQILEASADVSSTPSNHYVGYVYLPYQWMHIKYEQ
jgi:lipopolysaccharide transport system ATP-binding protein